MRIGIIGHPCIDEVIHPGASSPKLALGGVLYSYAAMERIMCELGSTEDSFAPLTWLCRADVPLLEPLLSKFKRMDRTTGLWPTDSLTNRVQLVYSTDGSRVEHCPNVLPELAPSQLTPELLASLGGLFINMISGFDVSIDTLEIALNAAEKRPYVHLDIHALVLGDLSNRSDDESYGGGRKPRGVREWQRWLAVADSIQLNELEARWLGDPEIQSEKKLVQFIERNLDRLRLKHLILTRGPKGATLYELRSEEVHHVMPPAMTPVDTTGAGDVFGSIFTYAMLAGQAPLEAVENAVRWATWCTTLSTIDDILTTPFPF